MEITFGRYRLLERIGQGGMAEVFKAKSFGVEGFEKIVVIKRILPELAARAEFVDMFIHEAKLAVRLSHANIVQVFDLGLAPMSAEKDRAAPQAYYMAMEYVHGLDLCTLLSLCRRRERPLPLALCVYLTSEIAKGLDHAHRRRDENNEPLGVVHRDISPQNVLLSLEGEVKVTDFGIAKAKGVLEKASLDDTQSQHLKGKFAYMSPEQAIGETVDLRSDLFSLGVLLYECVTLVNPFSGPTTFETLRRVQSCEYPPLELLRTDAPEELSKIVKRAMAPRADDRYPNAGAFYEALVAFLYSQGGRAASHDLAALIAEVREPVETDVQTPLLSIETKTPVDVPSKRTSLPSLQRAEPVSGPPEERGATRREVTAVGVMFASQDSDDAPVEAARALTRYGGIVAHQSAEQVIALFGVTEPDGRDCELAARAALVTLRGLPSTSRAGIGVHMAPIFVQDEKTPVQDGRFEELLATTRLLARAFERRIVASASVQRHASMRFAFDEIEAGERTSLAPGSRFLSGAVPAAAAYGKFVGRKEELRFVGEVLAQATRRRARVLSLRGDHGIGKTRLLGEVERRLRKLGYNVGWFGAACPPRGREWPFSGIACMLQVLVGVAEGEGGDRVLEAKGRLRALGLTEQECAATLDLLGGRGETGEGELRGLLANAFARMVQRLTEDRPHVFAWDAAHAMDAESFALLEDVFSRLKSARTVFVLSARAGFTHPLEKLEGHVAVDLSELPPEDVERLVALRLGVERVPAELVRFLRERAGGHPQYLEELTLALRDSRAVTVGDGAVVSLKLSTPDLSLPRTLRGLMASRVMRLDPEGRKLLQASAVLGDVVPIPVLAHASGRTLARLERDLEPLIRDFLVQTGPEELRFRSPMAREVVLEELSPTDTQELHQSAARAYEEIYGSKVHDHAVHLATHLYEAGDHGRAAAEFARSGQQRLKSRQLEAAARDLERALALADESEDAAALVAWLSSYAQAVRLARPSREAAELGERVVAKADLASDPELRVKARVSQGRVLVGLQDFDRARECMAQALDAAMHVSSLEKLVLAARAELDLQQGEVATALEALERLGALATKGGDRAEEHRALLALAEAHAAGGDLGEALRALERAEKLLPQDKVAACERQKQRATVMYYAHDYRASAAAAEKATEQARSLGLSREVATNMLRLGTCLVRMNERAQAYGALKQTLALAEDLGMDRLVQQSRALLGFLDALAGDHAGGLSKLNSAVTYAEAAGYTGDVLSASWLRAELYGAAGKDEERTFELNRLRVLARAAGNIALAEDCERLVKRR